MSEGNLLHSQEIYFCNDELLAKQIACLETLYDFNQTRPSQQALRQEIMQQLFA